MQVGQLVTSKKKEFDGIGCVAKTMKRDVKVNHGQDSVMTCNPKNLSPVDISGCKTIKFADFQRMCIGQSKELPTTVIIGNEVKEYVGIGFIFRAVVDHSDLKKYPIIVQ